MDLAFEEQPQYEHYRNLFRNLTKRLMKQNAHTSLNMFNQTMGQGGGN